MIRFSLARLMFLSLLLLGGLFIQEAFAANKTWRCRPTRTQNFAACREKIEAKQQAIQKRRGIPRIRRTVQRRETTPTTPVKTSTTTQRRSSRALKTYDRRLSRRVQSTQLVSFEAQNIDFSIAVPQGYTLLSDTLQQDTGAMVFRQSRSHIRVNATSDRCEGGPTASRACLQRIVDEELRRIQRFQSGARSVPIINEEKIWLRNTINPKQLGKSSSGRYLVVETPQKRMGRFFFFEPFDNFVWEIEFEAPNRNGELLSDEGLVERILFSLFSQLQQGESARAVELSQKLSFLDKNRNAAQREVRRASRVKIDSGVTDVFEADNLNFRLTLPSAFTKQSDTLELAEGEMVFVSSDSQVVITATDTICDSQTPRIVQRCIEEHAEKFLGDRSDIFRPRNIVKKTNFSLQLVNAQGNLRRTGSFQRDLGRYHLYRSGGRRYAQFVFREPFGKHLWVLRAEAPENNYALLSDVRQMQKTITSLFFEGQE